MSKLNPRKFKSALILASFLTFNAMLNPALGLAIIATPTPLKASVTNVPTEKSETVNQNLKKVIDKVIEENKDAVDAKVLAAKQKTRGLVGEVKSVRADTLTIKTPKGTQILAADKNVKLIKAGKIIATSDIAVGDWVSIIGEIKDDDFKALTVIVSSKSLATVEPTILLGTIESFAKQELKVSNRADGQSQTFSVLKTSIWQDVSATKAAANLFKDSLQVFLVGIETETGPTLHTIRALAPFTRPTQPAK